MKPHVFESPYSMIRLVAVSAAAAVSAEVVRALAKRPRAAAPSKLRRFMLRLLLVRDVAGLAPAASAFSLDGRISDSKCTTLRAKGSLVNGSACRAAS